MTHHSVMGLINNAALLLALGLIYDTVFIKSSEKNPAIYQVITGLIIGSIGIAIMLTPWELMPGVVFDTRSVLLSVAGFFFGPIPAILATLITGGFRLMLGGLGMWTGVLVILVSGGSGLVWRRLRNEDFHNISLWEFYIFGMIVHVLMLLCMLTLPGTVAGEVLAKISIPVLLIFPVGTALLGQLMMNRHRRIKAEIELVQIKNFTENALNAQNDIFFVLNPTSGKAVWWNRAFKKITGYSDREISEMKAPHSYCSREDLRKAAKSIEEMTQKGKATVEISLITQSGKTIPTEFSISPITSIEQNKPYVISIGRDISERKKAESALKESESRLRAITATAVDAIFCKDAARRYTFVNQAMAAMVGLRVENLIGKTPEEIFDAESAAVIKEVDDRTFNGESVNETRSLQINGREFVLNTIQVPMEIEDEKVVSINGIVRDITEIMNAQKEKLKLEAQLRQSQKLESIGILSGGIAHDFNNLLYVITGNTELLLNKARTDDKEMMHHIQNAARRGADLVKQLLAFSRKSETNLQILRLNDEIRRIYKMLERIIPKMIEIQLNLADDLYTVDADPGQIEQVLMNLSLNARDAMTDTGKLIIRTENTRYNHQRSVMLEVSDTGHGIAAKDLDKIFDPFFTTKEIGKGSGLGLSVIYGIIKAHNGEIFCKSKPGAGTTFTIYLPAARGVEAYRSEIREPISPVKGRETILVVDDDENVSRLTRTILARLGYKTFSASDGETALEIYAQKRKEIDLVLLDLGMPGMGGAKCLERLIQQYPDVKIVIASGYMEDGIIDDRLKHGAKAAILKPFTIEKFSKVIRNVLDDLPV